MTRSVRVVTPNGHVFSFQTSLAGDFFSYIPGIRDDKEQRGGGDGVSTPDMRGMERVHGVEWIR